jgi:predicted dehydrogenase
MKTLQSLLFACVAVAVASAQESPPVRLAIVGLAHDHVGGILPELAERHDITLVGIVEADRALAESYASKYNLEPELFFPSIAALVAKTKVDAVATFTSTYDHPRVVEECAPLGIDVMMEKPMAVSVADARRIAAAAAKGGIQIVVNYETTWYASNHAAFDYVHGRNGFGEMHKIVVRDGHWGPKAIGCSPAFLNWLTDPVLNGGGAGMDFGCYGADLVTWLMEGRRPTSVSAVYQRLQPDAYPKVEDEATIVVSYPGAQAIIEASWNWPFGRKDMEIYGKSEALFVPDGKSLLLRTRDAKESPLPVAALPEVESNSLSYLAAVVRDRIKPSGLSSLETNLVVCEILDAANQSARTGRRVDLPAGP